MEVGNEMEILEILTNTILTCGVKEVTAASGHYLVYFPYLSYVPPTGGVWHKDFFKCVRVKGRRPDTPDSSKNASGPISIPIKGEPQAPGYKPSSSKEG